MNPQAAWIDAVGTRHVRADAGARIACLVPSITELVCALGLGPQLVARTGFCIHPTSELAAVPKVGGTKDVNLARLAALAPSHVIVNIDENEKPVVEEIARFVPHVIVTHPCAPQDNPALYRLIGGVFGRDAQAESLCMRFDAALQAARRDTAGLPRERVLYLIWKKPWMSVAPDTYISRTLAAVGWDTVPEGATPRYPEVDPGVLGGQVDRLLLSSEPYRFGDGEVAELRAMLPTADIRLIDGEMTSWYGPRAIEGLAYLAALRRRLADAGTEKL